MTIWRTEVDSDYKSLGYDNERHVRQIMSYERGELSEWSPVYVQVVDEWGSKHERMPGFPGLSMDITCNEETKSILDELLHDYVDFLPLASHTIRDDQYYILYPNAVLDCLDYDESELVRLRSGYIRGVRRYVFKPACIGTTPIFRLPIAGSPIGRPYVNDRFKQLVAVNSLTGLKFSKVWDG